MGLEVTCAPASSILGDTTSSSPSHWRIDHGQKISGSAGGAAEIWEANRLQHRKECMIAHNRAVVWAHFMLCGIRSSSCLCLYDLNL